jgi:hypothetical protein
VVSAVSSLALQDRHYSVSTFFQQSAISSMCMCSTSALSKVNIAIACICYMLYVNKLQYTLQYAMNNIADISDITK